MNTIKFCQHLFIDIDYCEPNRCQNGGSCTDLVDGYSCLCATGYTGTDCQTGENDQNEPIVNSFIVASTALVC